LTKHRSVALLSRLVGSAQRQSRFFIAYRTFCPSDVGSDKVRLMRRFLVVVACLGSVVVSIPAAASARVSDDRPCVTRGEFDQAHKGMTRLRVHAIFDTAGKRLFINVGQVTNEGREYVVCGHPRSGGSFVQVQYNNYATNGGPLRLAFKQMQVH
jgi:hypothetical protein